ncbi:hypothetical protein [Bradyrhizobium sp. dw_78]|uniref:hypothetical protein n=1 Tax=Bradyrhizobium sp. dw_78 TaxID=2719793 RepID=UPI00201C5875|nr:hypothetical protein [Bradyrhizobium sp. dw_78]
MVVPVTLAVAVGAVFAVDLAAVLGMALRETGRGFGSGTLDAAAASVANADHAMVSARPVAKTLDRAVVDRAVNRKAFGRVNWITAFLRSESSIDDALGPFE